MAFDRLRTSFCLSVESAPVLRHNRELYISRTQPYALDPNEPSSPHQKDFEKRQNHLYQTPKIRLLSLKPTLIEHSRPNLASNNDTYLTKLE